MIGDTALEAGLLERWQLVEMDDVDQKISQLEHTRLDLLIPGKQFRLIAQDVIVMRLDRTTARTGWDDDVVKLSNSSMNFFASSRAASRLPEL